MEYLFYCLSIMAILTVAFARYRLGRLRRRVAGGTVATKFNAIGEFMSLFVMAPLAFSFLPLVDDQARLLIAAAVFFFAGVFSVVTVNLFSAIVDDIGL